MEIKGPGILREYNSKKILSLLRRNRQTSRKDLVKLMGVSKNTVSIIVDQYIKEGVIREVGVKDLHKAGRPKILIELNPNVFKAAGFVIHHDGIEYVVTNYDLNIVKRGFEKMETENPLTIFNRIKEMALGFLSEYPEMLGVGIGVPGIVNSNEGIVYESTNLKWKNINVTNLLKNDLPIPFIVQNSVKMASLCSNIFGESPSHSSLFYIRIGNGVGGAFLIGEQIWNGDSWTSGEIGHISVNADGPHCACGQKGCLEVMINKKAFIGWSEGFKELSKEEQEKLIEERLKQYGNYLGISLISVINMMNPKEIIIDSPYNQHAIFQKSLNDYLQTNALKIPYENTKIHFNDKTYSPTLGAATAVILNYEKVGNGGT